MSVSNWKLPEKHLFICKLAYNSQESLLLLKYWSNLHNAKQNDHLMAQTVLKVKVIFVVSQGISHESWWLVSWMSYYVIDILVWFMCHAGIFYCTSTSSPLGLSWVNLRNVCEKLKETDRLCKEHIKKHLSKFSLPSPTMNTSATAQG